MTVFCFFNRLSGTFGLEEGCKAQVQRLTQQPLRLQFKGESVHRPQVVQQGTADVDLIFFKSRCRPQISDLSQSGGDTPLLGGDRYRRRAPCCSLQLK